MEYPKLYVNNDLNLNANFEGCKLVATLDGLARKLLTIEGEVLFNGTSFDYIINYMANPTYDRYIPCYIEWYSSFYSFQCKLLLSGTYDYLQKSCKLKLQLPDEYDRTILDGTDTYFVPQEQSVPAFYRRDFTYNLTTYIAWDINKILFTKLRMYSDWINNNPPYYYDDLGNKHDLNFVISAKSDIKRQSSSNPANFKIKVSKILEILKGMFNYDYHFEYFAGAGNFNVFKTYSQIYYENTDLGIDFTNYKGVNWTLNNNSYKIDLDSKPIKETLEFESSRDKNYIDFSDFQTYYTTYEYPWLDGNFLNIRNYDLVIVADYTSAAYNYHYICIDKDNLTSQASYVRVVKNVFGSETIYNSYYLGVEEKKIQLSDVNNDFQWLILNPTSTSDDGYFVANINPSTNTLNYTLLDKSNEYHANAAFAASQLFNTILKYGRTFKTGSTIDSDGYDKAYNFEKELDRKTLEISLPLTIEDFLDIRFYKYNKISIASKAFFEKIELPLNGEFAKCLLFYHEDEQLNP